MDRCDVLIVGGGPAGSSCAWALRHAGLDVLVLDKATFPRDKPCAGWIVPQLLASLELNVAEYAEQRTLQPISGFVTGRIGGPHVQTNYGRVVSYAIRRCELDAYLLDRCGARVALGQPVSLLERVGKGWLVNRQIRTPLLIGAAGHFCPVARLLNGRPSAGRVVLAQVAELAIDERELAACRVRPEVPELYFSPDLAGYGWCVRKNRHLNVGLGRLEGRGLQDELRELLKFLVSAGRIPAGLDLRWRGHAYLLHGPGPRRLIDDGVLLVGDAAGLADPASGEGIRPAVESGLLAARAVLRAQGRFDREELEAYRCEIEGRLGRPRGRSNRPGALAEALGRWLLGSGWFARHVLLDRWFLHRSEGPLMAPATPAP